MAHKVNTLQSLLVGELKDLLDCEHQLVKTLPKLSKAASSDELRTAFETHLRETNQHVDRLGRVFEMLGEEQQAKKCAGIRGIIDEGDELMDEVEGRAVDAALVIAGQKAEHYEIASYGSAATHADTLGKPEIASILRETLSEEKRADQKLTDIATRFANDDAYQGDSTPRGTNVSRRA